MIKGQNPFWSQKSTAQLQSPELERRLLLHQMVLHSVALPVQDLAPLASILPRRW